MNLQPDPPSQRIETPESATCQVCGAALRPTDAFCSSCGTLAAPAASIQAAPPISAAPTAQPRVAPPSPVQAPTPDYPNAIPGASSPNAIPGASSPNAAPAYPAAPLAATLAATEPHDAASPQQRCNWCGSMNLAASTHCAVCGAVFPRPEQDALLRQAADARMRQALAEIEQRRARRVWGFLSKILG